MKSKQRRGTMMHVVCLVCRKPFSARVSDRARGWAKCCGKSCAATYRQAKLATDLAPRQSTDLRLLGSDEMATSGPEFDFGGDV